MCSLATTQLPRHWVLHSSKPMTVLRVIIGSLVPAPTCIAPQKLPKYSSPQYTATLLNEERDERERGYLRAELNKNLKSLGSAGTCRSYLPRVLARSKLSRLKFYQLSYDKIIDRRGSPVRVDHVPPKAAI